MHPARRDAGLGEFLDRAGRAVEVCGIADRALVFHRGRIVTELSAAELSMARLVRAATGDAGRVDAIDG
jgi:hypothetical protein